MGPSFGIDLSPRSLRTPNQRVENSSAAPGHLRAGEVPRKVVSYLNNTGSWRIYTYSAAKEHSHVLLMIPIENNAWYNIHVDIQKFLDFCKLVPKERTGDHTDRKTTQEETFENQASKV